MKTIKRVTTKNEEPDIYGTWTTAKDWFPTIEINQETGVVKITTYDTRGYQKKASISTTLYPIRKSKDRTQMYVRGEVECRNFIHWQASKTQEFCFAVFVGDSDHIYTHRASATKGWMNGDPDNIRKRLVKLGIGAVENVIQQGDFLLKPANGNAYPDSEFRHETMGAGHHNFEMPVLYASGKYGRQYKIVEATMLTHRATDGIQHPTITVPPGMYAVGTTANQLEHSNMRD